MTTGELIEYLYRFNPRPRTGGDNLALSLPGAGAVSTHSDSPFSPDLGVSTHAPARGATDLSVQVRRSFPRFNPRPRTGGDENLCTEYAELRVSTHAPARGAT